MRTKFTRSVLCVVLALMMIFTIMPLTTIKTKASYGIDQFVERCYRVTFNRDPDQEGFNYWRNRINNGELVGSTTVYYFIFSDEYKALNRNDEEFVNDLYTMFMGRAADQEGYEYWCGKLQQGVSREEVFAGFANSQEFFQICHDWDLQSGFFTNDYPVDQVNNINLFVERIYQICLERSGEQGGQKYWVEGLLTGKFTGSEVVCNYIFSEEYTLYSRSDEQFIKDLYKCCMGREYDNEGLQYWMEQKGITRSNEYVFEGFVNSPEFAEICAKYGINKGTYSSGITVDTSKEKLYVCVYNGELEMIVDDYVANHPDFPYQIVFTTYYGYEEANDYLVNKLPSGDANTPDIFMMDPDYLYTYVKGDMSKYVATYESLGIDVNTAITQGEIANYNVELGTNKDGKLAALGYEADVNAFIYRRSIAKAIWGSDDPSVVKSKIGGGTGSWNQFEVAAAEANRKGYAITSSTEDFTRIMIDNSASWIKNGKLYIAPEKLDAMRMAKEFTTKGYTNGTSAWSDDWYIDMSGNGEKPVLGYFGPSWLGNYTIFENCDGTKKGEGTYGDWAVCEAPVTSYWGGTQVLATKKSIDQGKKDAVRDLVYYLTLDCSNNGFQYKIANGTACTSNNKKIAVLSGKIMKAVDGRHDLYNGQNINEVYLTASKKAKGNTNSQYDEYLRSYFFEAIDNISYYDYTDDEALENFKREAYDKFGILSE